MEIDNTNISPEYWEKILRSFGLGMNRGKSVKCMTRAGHFENRQINYIGGNKEIKVLDEKLESQAIGKRSKGSGPDSDE